MKDEKKKKAGLIPYYVENKEIYMLFMRPSDPKYGGPDLQIAKGEVDEGNSYLETAISEAFEELGLYAGNIKSITEIGIFLSNQKFFIASIKDKDMFGDFHYETGETKWLTLQEFLKVGRDIHKPIVQAAVRLIKSIEDL